MRIADIGLRIGMHISVRNLYESKCDSNPQSEIRNPNLYAPTKFQPRLVTYVPRHSCQRQNATRRERVG